MEQPEVRQETHKEPKVVPNADMIGHLASGEWERIRSELSRASFVCFVRVGSEVEAVYAIHAINEQNDRRAGILEARRERGLSGKP